MSHDETNCARMLDSLFGNETPTPVSNRILAARFGTPPPSYNASGKEFLSVIVAGDAGRSSMARIAAEIGPLQGRVEGLLRECTLEKGYDKGVITEYLFSLPDQIVPCARMRNNQRAFATGCWFAVTEVDRREFSWTGAEAAGKGGKMDAYPPPSLSAAWVDRLANPETDGLVGSFSFGRSNNVAPAAVIPATPRAPVPKPRPNGLDSAKSGGRVRLTGMKVSATTLEGRKALYRLENRYGKLPSVLLSKNSANIVQIIGVPLDRVDSLVSGELLPGLTLEHESWFVPSVCVSEGWLSAFSGKL